MLGVIIAITVITSQQDTSNSYNGLGFRYLLNSKKIPCSREGNVEILSLDRVSPTANTFLSASVYFGECNIWMITRGSVGFSYKNININPLGLTVREYGLDKTVTLGVAAFWLSVLLLPTDILIPLGAFSGFIWDLIEIKKDHLRWQFGYNMDINATIKTAETKRIIIGFDVDFFRKQVPAYSLYAGLMLK